jgi:hypothetical protein
MKGEAFQKVARRTADPMRSERRSLSPGFDSVLILSLKNSKKVFDFPRPLRYDISGKRFIIA